MTNKTPLQELIEHIEKQKTFPRDCFMASVHEKATELLEKEKSIIVDACDAMGKYPGFNNGEDYFNQTFKP